MATKEAIAAADVDALVRSFCGGCGFHLGVVQPRPWKVKNEGLYALIGKQFSWIIGERGWSYGEVSELLAEANREKRMLREPLALVDGRLPRKQRKDPDRNLLAGESAYHPALQVMRMPCVSLSESREAVTEEEGYVGGRVPSFTMRELLEYWESRVGDVVRKDELAGSLAWLVDHYDLATVLHAVDRLALSLSDERDPWVRALTDPFKLKALCLEVQGEREEARKWL